MEAGFVCDVSNARLARNKIDRSEGFVAKYVVERVVYLHINKKCILITKVVFMWLCFVVCTATLCFWFTAMAKIMPNMFR